MQISEAALQTRYIHNRPECSGYKFTISGIPAGIFLSPYLRIR